MQNWHPASGLLCGVLILSGSAGCAGNSSVVARRGMDRCSNVAPERLISIARVFESQGRLEQADAMYRKALQHDPSNNLALNRIAHIASLNQTRTFRGPNVDSGLPVDSQLFANHKPSAASVQFVAPAAPPRSVASTQNSQVPMFAQPEAESVVAADRAVFVKTVHPASIAYYESPPTEPPGGARLDSMDSASQLVSDTVTVPAHPTASNVMADWLDAPARHVEELLATLQSNRHPDQRTLAATLLAEAPAGDTRVNSALEAHCVGHDAIVAAAAADSLLVRGVVSSTSVPALLALADHSDSEIRGRVSSSMRMLAGTTWEADAVQMLITRLDDSNPAVRGMAALTLGDFGHASEVILERLVDRYSVETDSGVRNSLELTAERIGTLPPAEHAAESVGS